MSFTRTALAALMIGSLALTACSDDDDPTGPTISQFAGVWTATEFRFTSQSTPGRTIDITDVGGALTLTIAATGTFTGSLTIPGVGQIPLRGDIEIEGDNEANVDFDWSAPFDPNDPPVEDFTATFTLTGNTLVFTNPDTEFDFDLQGPLPSEASVVVITMTRAS